MRLVLSVVCCTTIQPYGSKHGVCVYFLMVMCLDTHSRRQSVENYNYRVIYHHYFQVWYTHILENKLYCFSRFPWLVYFHFSCEKFPTYDVMYHMMMKTIQLLEMCWLERELSSCSGIQTGLCQPWLMIYITYSITPPHWQGESD